MKKSLTRPLSLSLVSSMVFAISACENPVEKEDAPSTEGQSAAPQAESNNALAELTELDSGESTEGTKAIELSLDEWKQELSSGTPLAEIAMMKRVVQAGELDAEGAVDFLVNAPHSPRRMATLRTVTANWTTADKQAAMAKADSLSDEKLQQVMRMAVIHNSVVSEAEQTRAWVSQWQESSPKVAQAALKSLERLENPDGEHECGPGCSEHHQH